MVLIKSGIRGEKRSEIKGGVSYSGKYQGRPFIFNIYHNGQGFDYDVESDFDSSPPVLPKDRDIIKAFCLDKEKKAIQQNKKK